MDDDCNVCVYDDGGDEPEFCDERWVKARKTHRCCECSRVIPIGETYERTVGKWDGEMQTHKTCEPCQEIRVTFCCKGWTYGRLWESVEEQLFPAFNETCVAKLITARAKAILSEHWRVWKFE